MLHRTITNCSIYDRCKLEPATALHALWSCKELEVVWEDVVLWGFQRSINFLSFKELLSWLIKNYQQLELFAVTAWSICNQRNQVHMHQPSCSPHLLVATARGRLAEFSSIQLAPRTPPSKPRVQWQSPPQGMVKINFDGATSARDQFLGIGVVLRTWWQWLGPSLSLPAHPIGLQSTSNLREGGL